MALGTLAASNDQGRHVNQAAEQWLDVLFLASFVSCAFWIWRMKGFRGFAICIIGVMQLFIVLAFFVAGMSVSGDWL